MKIRRLLTALAASAALALPLSAQPADAWALTNIHLANGCTIWASNQVYLTAGGQLVFSGTVSAATQGSGCVALQVKLYYAGPDAQNHVTQSPYIPLGFLPAIGGRYVLQIYAGPGAVSGAFYSDHNALPVVPWLGGGARGVRLYCC